MNDQELRNILKFFNMRELSKKAGIGYSTLKNFSSGYSETMKPELKDRVIRAINSIKL